MADVLKYGNPIRLAQLAADPSSPENGTLYYNTTDGVVKQYVAGGWQEVPDQALTLVGLSLNDGFLIVGNGSNVSASFDSASVGDIDADATTGLTIKAGVIVNADINASAAIALSKLAAVTASRALQSDGSGFVSASSVTSTELGHVSGVTSAIQTQLNAKEASANKGIAGGYASLDGSGKVPVAQLPNAIMEYQGTWNATTNTPTLIDGTGSIGDVYRVTVAGTQNLGSGNITFAVSDYVILNSSLVWEKADTTDAVTSVNGFTGAVSLNTDNIAEGAALYFTDERAQDAAGALATSSSKVSLTYNDGANTLTPDIVVGSLVNADINASAAIDATKIGNGDVDNTELSYVNGVTSSIQTQFTGKANTALSNLASVAVNTALLPASAAAINHGSPTLPFNQIHARSLRNEEASVNFTGDTTSGSPIITNVSSAVGLAAGSVMSVVGSGIPYFTSISTIDSATQITLDANATATATGVSLSAASSMIIISGTKTGSSGSGAALLRSGNTVNANSGSVLVRSGNASGTGNSGDVQIRSGTVSSGTRGSVTITGNNIILNGSGSIQPALSVIPTTDNTRDLGSASLKFKDAYLGNSLVIEDPGAGTNKVTLQAATATAAYTLTYPSALPGSTQAVTLSATGQLGTSAFSAASAGDISETSYTALVNNTADQVITGLAFNNATVRSFKAQVSVLIDATSDLFAVYELMGIQRGADWQMSESYTGDTITSFSFNITSAGQVRATIGNIAGFSAATIKFRAETLTV